MEINDRKSMHSAPEVYNENHHTKDVTRERSSSANTKHSSRHHHRDGHHHHRSSKRHNSLKTLDIDRFLFQPSTEKAVETNETRECSLPPGDKESYLNLLSTELQLCKAEITQGVTAISKPVMNVINSLGTNREDTESPPSRNGTMDEYSVSDLVTSDDSVSNIAVKRRHGMQHNVNRNFESADKLSHNGEYSSKGSHDDNVQSKSSKIRERRVSKVKNTHNVSKESKDNIVVTIEKYLKICHLNYEQVESQINSTFSTLSNSINYRRKALIEEAKVIRDRKIDSLNEAKSKFLESKQPVSSVGNLQCAKEHVDSNGDVNDASLSQLDDPPIYKGIYEPWGSEETSNEVDQKVNNVDDSLNSNGIDGSLKSNEPGKLEEGNMTFHFDEKESNFFSKIGNIKENLSSPQCSFTKGLSGVIGIIGDKIDFEVHTHNIQGGVNANLMDRLVIRVYDGNKKKVPVEVTSSHSSSQRSNSLTSHILDELKTDPGVYFYSFTPLKSGNHEVLVKLNDVEIATSPFMLLVYTKSDLTFENMAVGRAFDRHCSDSELKYQGSPSSQSEDNDSGSDEDTFYPNAPSMLDRDWIVQKGGKSSILRSLTNVPSNIYATAEVRGMCAWQMRVTSACMNIVLSVGVKTRCGIPDLDEQFTCEFYMGTFVKTATTLDKVNHPNHMTRRKSSMFTRLSWTFTILLNNGIIRVTCHELDEDKQVEINLLNTFTLHPFCSMIHHHKGFVSQVCPRPQLTFL